MTRQSAHFTPSYANLSSHHKVKAFCRLTGCSKPLAIGTLHMLWHWAITSAPSGDLTRFSPQNIADAVEWEGDAIVLVDSLIESQLLDRSAGSLLIHDWDHYYGKVIRRVEQNREAKRRQRDQDTLDSKSGQHDTAACQHDIPNVSMTPQHVSMTPQHVSMTSLSSPVTNKASSNGERRDISMTLATQTISTESWELSPQDYQWAKEKLGMNKKDADLSFVTMQSYFDGKPVGDLRQPWRARLRKWWADDQSRKAAKIVPINVNQGGTRMVF